MSGFWSDEENLYGDNLQSSHTQPANISSSAIGTQGQLARDRDDDASSLSYNFRKIGKYRIIENTPECREAVKPYSNKVYCL